MKISLILIILLSLVSCREEEGVWDKLTQEERDALRLRASTKCLAAEQDDIDDIIATSKNNLEDYRRLFTWNQVYSKETTPSTVIDTNQIIVWKVNSSTVYFLHIINEGGTTKHKFIKTSIAQNTQQWLDLQRKKCAKTFTTSSLSSTAFTGSEAEDRLRIDADSYSILTTTFNYSRDFPAFFGMLNRTRVKKSYDDDSTVVKATETYKYTIKKVTNITTLSTNYLSFANVEYCMASYTPATVGPPATSIYYPLPNLSTALKCTTTTVDADGDAVVDFDPAVDLIGVL